MERNQSLPPQKHQDVGFFLLCGSSDTNMGPSGSEPSLEEQEVKAWGPARPGAAAAPSANVRADLISINQHIPHFQALQPDSCYMSTLLGAVRR